MVQFWSDAHQLQSDGSQPSVGVGASQDTSAVLRDTSDKVFSLEDFAEFRKLLQKCSGLRRKDPNQRNRKPLISAGESPRLSTG